MELARWIGLAAALGACTDVAAPPGSAGQGGNAGVSQGSMTPAGSGAADAAAGMAPAAMMSGAGGGSTPVATTSGSGGVGGDAGMRRDAAVSGTGGAAADSGSAVDSGSAADCSAAGLVWRTAQKTHYTSYPDPGSQECIQFNGCMWEGQFAACDSKQTEAWVAAHNVVAAFPDFASLELHDLCLRSGANTIVVTVLDTCGDSDCGGCCTQNQRDADELIDIESYTDQRWGVQDGRIEWADLGPTRTSGCN